MIPKINGYYIGQVRPYGARTWETVTCRRKSAEAALTQATRAMRQSDFRLRVLFVDDQRGWLNPVVAVELKRSRLQGCELERA